MVKREGNKYNFSLYNWLYLLSHLAWVRGLKSLHGIVARRLHTSHLAWVRGLKYIFFNSKIYLFYRTSLGCVDWSSTTSSYLRLFAIAPRVGAWIVFRREIHPAYMDEWETRRDATIKCASLFCYMRYKKWIKMSNIDILCKNRI